MSPALAPVAQDTAVLSIVVVDDHAMVRTGLRMLLDQQAGWRVAAEAADLQGAYAAVAQHHPDVVVLDLHLREESGLDAIGQLLERAPHTRVVVLTMEAHPAFAREALQLGASGYVLKEAAEQELVSAVRAAAAGRTYLQPRLGALLAAQPRDVPGLDDLSPREQEVLGLLALGHTNAEIADALALSRRTVETHRANLQHKLDLTTRADLTRFALDHHMI